MYTILVTENNELYGSNKERIMQRSKLVDNLIFIVDHIYKGIDMTDATVMLEYVLPVSKEYKTEILTLSEERYKDCYLQYKLPFDTSITSQAGEIQLQLTFVKTDLDVNGKGIQRVRKTSTTTINIIPISAWSDIIPDSALLAIDERLIKLDAQMRAMEELNQTIIDEKADNIKYNEETNELQLTSRGNEIGDKVALKMGKEDLKDGVPVVDFGSASDEDPSVEEDEDDNVVEF